MRLGSMILLLCLSLLPGLARSKDQAPMQDLAIGIGYPDLRLRYGLGRSVDTEAKFAFAEGVQVYSARLLWNFADLGQFKLLAGGEGGYAVFNGVQQLSGNGTTESLFVGTELAFAKRFRLGVDVGPAWLQAEAEGQRSSTNDIVVNTALYLYLF